jgi:Na+/H+-dicarboxylate symporter
LAPALRSLLFWVLLTVVAVTAVSVMIPSLFFSYFSPDEQMITNIGALLGRSADSIDVEFAIDARHAAEIKGAADSGIFALVPTNIFASLSSNDSVRVLVFAAIFGIGMVLTERQSGHSIFDALSNIQASAP